MPKARQTKTRTTRRRVLHAPWRIQYVLGPKDDGCFLCTAAGVRFGDEAGWKKLLLVHRDAHVVVVMNRYPYTGGHLLVAPRTHGADLGALAPGEQTRLWEACLACVQALKQTLRPQGFNVGLNLGRAAGAGLEEHLHAHVVPRWVGDTNFLPVLSGVGNVPIALEDLWDQLRPVFRELCPRES